MRDLGGVVLWRGGSADAEAADPEADTNRWAFCALQGQIVMLHTRLQVQLGARNCREGLDCNALAAGFRRECQAAPLRLGRRLAPHAACADG